jgi:dihydrolipoamide dehydrogenase
MFDVAIIGGGPAGYLAAERLGHRGKKVLLIEKQFVGGVCLNVGCIPTKTLLNSAKQYVHAQEAHKFGVMVQGVSYDWPAIQAWKSEVVTKLRSGIAGQLKKYGVEVIEGSGELIAPPSGSNPGKVALAVSETQYETRTILVATGSSSTMPPIPGSKDNSRVVDSTRFQNA